MSERDTYCYALISMVVFGQNLDPAALKVSSNLNNSIILCKQSKTRSECLEERRNLEKGCPVLQLRAEYFAFLHYKA